MLSCKGETSVEGFGGVKVFGDLDVVVGVHPKVTTRLRQCVCAICGTLDTFVQPTVACTIIFTR